VTGRQGETVEKGTEAGTGGSGTGSSANSASRLKWRLASAREAAREADAHAEMLTRRWGGKSLTGRSLQAVIASAAARPGTAGATEGGTQWTDSQQQQQQRPGTATSKLPIDRAKAPTPPPGAVHPSNGASAARRHKPRPPSAVSTRHSTAVEGECTGGYTMSKQSEEAVAARMCLDLRTPSPVNRAYPPRGGGIGGSRVSPTPGEREHEPRDAAEGVTASLFLPPVGGAWGLRGLLQMRREAAAAKATAEAGAGTESNIDEEGQGKRTSGEDQGTALAQGGFRPRRKPVMAAGGKLRVAKVA
jgi:hypothetical protein